VLGVNDLCTCNAHLLLTNKAGLNHILQEGRREVYSNRTNEGIGILEG
jgi:hypothetical protein